MTLMSPALACMLFITSATWEAVYQVTNSKRKYFWKKLLTHSSSSSVSWVITPVFLLLLFMLYAVCRFVFLFSFSFDFTISRFKRILFFFFCIKWVEEILLSLHIQDNLLIIWQIILIANLAPCWLFLGYKWYIFLIYLQQYTCRSVNFQIACIYYFIFYSVSSLWGQHGKHFYLLEKKEASGGIVI